MAASAMHLYAFSLALIAPLLVLAVALVFGVKAGIRARGFQISVAALPVALAVNPLVQTLVLEDRDARAGQELRRRAEASRLVGKRAEAVQVALGPPTSTRSETERVFTLGGQMVWESKPNTVWEYTPLRFYWSASSLQVHFKDDVVSRVEARTR